MLSSVIMLFSQSFISLSYSLIPLITNAKYSINKPVYHLFIALFDQITHPAHP